MARDITVRIVGDPAQLERAFSRAKVSATSFDRQMKGVGQTSDRTFRGILAGSGVFHSLGRSVAFASSSFLGGAGLVYAVKSAVSAASNLHEQTTKTETVFGDAAKSVIAFSNNALGLARDQALETASSIGSLLRPLGILPQEAAKTSVKLTKLGVDLSSFYNTSVQDALDAIRSGLVGEVEPLRRYGIVLSETRVQQEALAETHKKSAKELTNAEKVQARVNLIMRDAKLASGDYAKTIGGTANQQREFEKNLRNTEIAIGQALLPQLNHLLKVGNDWLSSSENQAKVADAVAQASDAISEAVSTAVPIIEDAWHAADKVAGALGGWKHTLELLLALKALSWLRNLSGGFAGVATQIGKANTNLAGEKGLLGGLGRLSKIGRISVPIALATTLTNSQGNPLAQVVQNGLLGLMFGGVAGGAAAAAATLIIRVAMSKDFNTPAEVVAGRDAAAQAATLTPLGRVQRGPRKGAQLFTQNGDVYVQYGTQQGGVRQLKKLADEEAAAMLGISVKQLAARVKRAQAAAPATTTEPTAGRGQAGLAARAAVGYATSHLGVPYEWGGGGTATGPSAGIPGHTHTGGFGTIGFDCSGLIASSYAQAGIKLPHNAAALAKVGVPVSIAQIQPGDILVVNGGSHCVMYVGGGQVVAASSASGKVVLQPLSLWARSGKIVAIRRVIPEREAGAKQAADRAAQTRKPATSSLVEPTGRGEMVRAAQAGAVAAGVDPRVFAGLIDVETGGTWNPRARSPKGAYGLTQLMPGTAKSMGIDLNRVTEQIRGGAEYFAKMLQLTGGDVFQALIAYNEGPGAWMAGKRYAESVAYAREVMRRAKKYPAGPGAAPSAPPRTDITQLTGVQRLRLAKLPGGSEGLAAEKSLLQIYLDRLKRKNLTPAEEADLRDAIASTKSKITAMEKQVAAAASEALRTARQRILRGVQTDPAGFASAMSGRASELVPGGAQAVNRWIANQRKQLKSALQLGRVSQAETEKVLNALLGMDPDAVIETTDKFGLTVQTKLSEVVRRVREINQEFATAMSTHDTKLLAKAQQDWAQYAGIIGNAIQAGNDVAQAKLAQQQQIFQTAFGRVTSTLLEGFDRETQAHISSMQAASQAQINAVQQSAQAQISQWQAQAQAQIQRIQERLQAQIKKLQEQLQKQLKKLEAERAQATPAEAELAALTGAHDAAEAARQLADARQELADAQQAPDAATPEGQKRIADAQRALDEILYQQHVAALQKQAEAERQAKDERIQQQQEELQKKEQAQEESLQKQAQAEQDQIQKSLDARIDALNKETEATVAALQAQEAAAEQDYQDQRALERQALEDTLNDWAEKIATGKASWADFQKWLDGQSTNQKILGGTLGRAFAEGYVRMLVAAYQAQQALLAGGNPGDVSLPSPGKAIGGGVSTATIPACFPAGTPVSTTHGETAIEQIQVGDKVLCWQFNDDTIVETTVTETFVHRDRWLVRITFVTDDLVGDAAPVWATVEATPEHPFWVVGRGWTSAGDLTAGMAVRGHDRDLVVGVSEFVTGARDVFNLHVDHPDHNYFAAGLLVHNKLAMAEGGKVPGRYAGIPDTVPGWLTSGETVIDRRLTRALEKAYLGGGLSGDQSIYDLAAASAAARPQPAPTILDFRGSLLLDKAPHVARQIARTLEPHLGKTIQIKTS